MLELTVGRFRQALGEIIARLDFGFGRPGVHRGILVRIGASPKQAQDNGREQKFHRSEVYLSSGVALAGEGTRINGLATAAAFAGCIASR